MITIIVAMTSDRVIGRDGGIPWHIPEDLKLFRETTMGHTVVMGRKTFQSIGKPLDGRLNIVISTTIRGTEEEKEDNLTGKLGAEGSRLIICPSFEEAIAAAGRNNREIFIIGGTEVYRQALPIADCIYLSRVFERYEGNVYFPPFDEGEWKKTASRLYEEFELAVYKRIAVPDS